MWLISKIMGTRESVISDDSSDSDSDYSLEPRPGSKRATSLNTRTHINPDVDILNTGFNLNLNEETGVAGAQAKIKASDLDVTTDAAMKTCHFPKPEEVLNLDGVLRIENELEVYEIVSLMYLLYEDAQYALQELTLLLKGAEKRILYDWATFEANRSVSWQKKVIEALCIIKNYQILKTLGYQKQDLIVRYLPHQPKAVTSINSIKKTLYLICEKLGEQKTDIFLQQVRLDFQEKNLPFEEYDPLYLELYFLKWETMKYLSPIDLSNIKKILKVMSEEVLYDYLNGALPQETTKIEDNPTQSNAQVSEIVKKPSKTRNPSTSVDTHLRSRNFTKEGFDNHQFPLPSIGRDNANTPRENHDENHVYKVDPENPGILLIINQEFFYKEVDDKFKDLLPTDDNYKFEIRAGTEKDSEDLSAIFKKFGFKVIVVNDLTHEEMVAKIKEVVKDIKDESSLFICIMSHGDKGIVYGSNSCQVKVSKIQDIVCKTNKEYLTGKPKILILQSCQGKTCQKINESSEEDMDENYTMATDGVGYSRQPRTVDMLTFWATVPGYAAIRNKRTGSWFIQALCKKMEENGNTLHFADICTRIVNDVSSRIWTVEEYENAMTPMVVSTLRRDFYLPPMRNV